MQLIIVVKLGIVTFILNLDCTFIFNFDTTTNDILSQTDNVVNIVLDLCNLFVYCIYCMAICEFVWK